MSGPKGYGYTVSSAEQRNRRECAEARGRCVTLRERVREVGHEVVAAGGSRRTLPTVVTADDLPALTATETRLRDLLAELEQERDRARAARRAASIGRRLAEVGGFELSVPETRTVRGSKPPSSVTAPARAPRRGAELSAVVEKLATIDDDAERARLEALASRATAAVAEGSVQAEVLLLRVSTEAANALHAQREARLVRSDAAEAELALGDVTGAEADTIRARLRAASTVVEVARLRTDVDELVARHRAARDRAFVVEQTADVLRRLGYEVEEGFVEVATAGGRTVVTRADVPEHALQLRFLANQDRVLARTVALADTDEESDVAAEEANCRHLEALQAGWAAAGVSARRDHEQPAGAVPVHHVSGRTVRRRGVGRSAVARERERTAENGSGR